MVTFHPNQHCYLYVLETIRRTKIRPNCNYGIGKTVSSVKIGRLKVSFAEIYVLEIDASAAKQIGGIVITEICYLLLKQQKKKKLLIIKLNRRQENKTTRQQTTTDSKQQQQTTRQQKKFP